MTGKQLMPMTLAGIVCALPLTALVAAQQSPGHTPRSMDNMMQGCRTHCQATGTSIDRLMTQIVAAKQSNDPAQMRAALDEAQKPLAEMKDHMQRCQHMMGMMQHMHSGVGGQMKGSQRGGMVREKGAQPGPDSR